LRTSPDDWRTNSFEVVVLVAALPPALASAMSGLLIPNRQ
jgi:hypothetical protein